MSEADTIRCKVTASAATTTTAIFDVRERRYAAAGAVDGRTVHVTRRAFDAYAERYPGLLTEQKKPGRKPKRKPAAAKPEPKPATQADQAEG